MSDSTSTDSKELNNGELNHPQNSGDEGDIAAALEEYERNSSLNNVLKSIPRSLPPDFDGCCVDCGEEIPEVRLKLFCIRCVDCQTKLEKMNKHFTSRNRIDSFGRSYEE